MLDTYSVELRPSDGGASDLFTLTMDVTSVSDVSFSSKTFAASGWLSMTWVDKRASWNAAIFSLFPGQMGWNLDEIYRPTFIWPNRLEDKIKNPQSLLESDGKGNFYYLTEFRGVFSCKMELDAYPVDTQSCAIHIISRESVDAIVLSAGGGIPCGPKNAGEYFVRYGNDTTLALSAVPHSEANFRIYFQRSSAFTFAVIIPCMMLFLVGYASFF